MPAWPSTRLARLVTLLALGGSLRAHAVAAQTGGGVLLRWDRCSGDGGVANRDFACDTNSGSEVLVASFRLGAPLPDPVAGQDLVISLRSATPVLPAWWSFKSGQCRSSALRASSSPPAGSLACADWALGQAVAAVSSIESAPFGDGTLRIRATTVIPVAVTVASGQEYFSLALQLSHSRTVGTGSCAGCATPVCIAFDNLTLSQQVFPFVLSAGADGEGSRFVSWQGGVAADAASQCVILPGDRLSCSLTFGCSATGVTAARAPTWGAVKSLYR